MLSISVLLQYIQTFCILYPHNKEPSSEHLFNFGNNFSVTLSVKMLDEFILVSHEIEFLENSVLDVCLILHIRP